MTDYTKTTNFTAKDSLLSGDVNKLIKGSLFDTEFDNIATAVNTKFDSGDIASQTEAENQALNTVLITPLRLANWAAVNITAASVQAGQTTQTLALDDANTVMYFGSNSTLTVPAHSSVAIPVGSRFILVASGVSTYITIVGGMGSGGILCSLTGAAPQIGTVGKVSLGGTATLIKITTGNVWTLFGDVEAA